MALGDSGESGAARQQAKGKGKAGAQKAARRAVSVPARSVHRGALMLLCFFCLCSPTVGFSPSEYSPDWGCPLLRLFAAMPDLYAWTNILCVIVQLVLGFVLGTCLHRWFTTVVSCAEASDATDMPGPGITSDSGSDSDMPGFVQTSDSGSDSDVAAEKAAGRNSRAQREARRLVAQVPSTLAMIAPRRASASLGSRFLSGGVKGWFWVMVLCACCHVTLVVAPRAPPQVSSVPASRASIYTGLPPDLAGTLDTIVHNRLSTSSWRTVESGVKLWRRVCEERGWPHIIVTDDPDRGGKLVAFVMSLLACTTLTWGTISSYVWGVRKFQQLQHQADPVSGVDQWTEFMMGIQVLTFEPSQPRRRTPIRVVYAIIRAVNLAVFWEVQCVFLILTMLFTYTRSECPCPKRATGRDSYDEEAHFNVEDFDPSGMPDSDIRGMWARFRRTKMDQRVERPEAQGDGDWSFMGDTGDEETSILVWYVRLQQFHGHRPNRRGPMFLNHDRSGAYLYSQFLRDFHALQERVGVAEADLTGTAGLRSAGYTATRNILGPALAKAHGGWESSTHNRYNRFESGSVARIPAAIMGLMEADMHPAEELENRVVERPSQRPQERITREHFALVPHRARIADSAVIGEPSGSHRVHQALPAGWSEEVRMPTSGRPYSIYHGPDEQRASSRVQAWRLHDTQAEPGVPSAELIERAAEAERMQSDSSSEEGYASDQSAAAYAEYALEREHRERESLAGPSLAIVSSTLGSEASSSSAPLAATPHRRLLPQRVHAVVQRFSPSFASDRNAA